MIINIRTEEFIEFENKFKDSLTFIKVDLSTFQVFYIGYYIVGIVINNSIPSQYGDLLYYIDQAYRRFILEGIKSDLKNIGIGDSYIRVTVNSVIVHEAVYIPINCNFTTKSISSGDMILDSEFSNFCSRFNDITYNEFLIYILKSYIKKYW